MSHTEDLLDQIVSEYSDRLGRGDPPDRNQFLQRAPADHRPGLERCLKMLEAGMARAPGSGTVLGPGTQLGRYQILSELGRGGMSIVYLARDDELKRPVALKVLRPGLAVEASHIDRFRREGEAVARLKHPHVVPVFDVGESQGYQYLTMEFVEGPTLATVLSALPRDRSPTAEDLARATGNPNLAAEVDDFEQAVARLLLPVAQALRIAHETGLVHRDVKPSNILIHRDGRAVIADFGLAKSDTDPALSMSGHPIGTPYYMSPEQARLTRSRIDHRTDVYSLGVTLYEALGGRRPFEGASFLEVIDAIRHTRPPSLRSIAPQRSTNAAAMVHQAMEFLADDRYPDMASLEADLLLLSQGRLTSAAARRGGWLRRGFAQTRTLCSGYPYEYRSARMFLGLPLVHINVGPSVPSTRIRKARGWLAISQVASGGVAIGGAAAFGLVAVAGGFAAGLFSLAGGLSMAMLLAVGGGLAVGSFATGGMAAGLVAFGGAAVGFAAIGGFARGRYAAGGDAGGTYRWDHLVHDPEVREFFETWLPFMASYLN